MICQDVKKNEYLDEIAYYKASLSEANVTIRNLTNQLDRHKAKAQIAISKSALKKDNKELRIKLEEAHRTLKPMQDNINSLASKYGKAMRTIDKLNRKLKK